MATAKHTAPAEAHRLTLISVPPDRSVEAIKFIRGMGAMKLERAFELLDDLPAVVQEFATAVDADPLHRLLAGIGARCKLEHVVDGEVVGGDAPAIAPEALAAQVDRAAAFGATPQGKALTDAEQALYSGIALLGTAISSLENETGERDDVEREVETLRIALERLEAARSSLDAATTAAVRS